MVYIYIKAGRARLQNGCRIYVREVVALYKRILAVGDVHGQYDKLVSLYDKLDFNPQEDLLIFLGDYIQGGDKPCEVLEWMIDHQHDNIVYLRGNTD